MLHDLYHHARPFFLALGFLSRLGPAMQVTSQEMAYACVYYPVVGLILGALFLIPSLLFSDAYWVQAWLYALVSAWMTRALHIDGLADVADALGSGKTGKEFRTVLKDSRLGAFGAVAIALFFCGQIILVHATLSIHQLAPLFYAPIMGRCLPIVLAQWSSPYSQTGLGAFVQKAPRTASLTVACILFFVVGITCQPTFLSFIVTCCFALCIIFFLVRLAKREGGYNGDFMGCAILTGELATLLAALV